MNIMPNVLAVLRSASEPLSNIAIREQIAALDDVPPIHVQHLVADAINKLVDADQVERVWIGGRCTYVIAPDPPPGFIGADPGIEVGATRHGGDPLPDVIKPPAQVAPTAPPPPPPAPAPPSIPSPPPAKATAMHATQQKIIDIITKAGTPLTTADILKKMPNVNAPAFAKHRQQLCDANLIVAHGATSARIYGLPGSQPPAESPKPESKPASAKPVTPPRGAHASAAASTAPAAMSTATSTEAQLSIADLRAAAADILLSHGARPLPRSLHRLVIAAVGAPESLAA